MLCHPSRAAAGALFCSHPPPSIIPLSPSTQLHHPTSSVAPASPPPRIGRAISSSYPCHSRSASPFLLHKLLKQQSVEGRTGAGTYLADPAVLLMARPARRTHPIGWPRLLSGSNGTLSVAGGAIGKQSMKMNYPVSLPSLMNK